MKPIAKTTRYRGLLALVLVLAGAFAIPAAQATTRNPLDTSFGAGGKVTTSLSSGADGARAVAVQPDGKIVAAGSNPSSSEFGLVRYNPDGSLDSGFGSGGKVTTVTRGGGEADALVLQPDGKIVIGGAIDSYTGEDFALARYNPDGSLDTSFGANGIVTTDILGHNDVATGLAVQPDGKIVAGGKANTGSSWDFALVRYQTNGSIDPSFGTNGKVTTSLGSGDSVANALVGQPDGKLILAGYLGAAPNAEFALARYTPDGVLDPSFGTGGKVTTGIESSEGVYSAGLQPDGKIVVLGGTVGGAFYVALVRYDTDGKLDPTFGDGGIASGDEGVGHAVAVQANGKILVAGERPGVSSNDFLLSRYDPDGSEDLTFGTDGQGGVATPIGSGNDAAQALALQPNGRIVVAGTTSVVPGHDDDLALARYLGSTLAIAKSGSGSGTVTSTPAGIHCGSACSAPFAGGSVTLTAKPSAGSVFARWSGDCSGKGRCTLTVGTDRSVVAKFSALCVVPKLRGKTSPDARRAIRQAHCSVGKVGGAYSPTVKRGRVISQNPRPGTKRPAHAKVRLTLSLGPR
ncbi:MAG: PASTA domain-containing protein [Gaiellaceae bacterium]